MQGDPARYGDGVGLWPTPKPGSFPGQVGAMLRVMIEAALAARSAQRHAVASGLGGSPLEQALELQAQSAEHLAKSVRLEVYY